MNIKQEVAEAIVKAKMQSIYREHGALESSLSHIPTLDIPIQLADVLLAIEKHSPEIISVDTNGNFIGIRKGKATTFKMFEEYSGLFTFGLDFKKCIRWDLTKPYEEQGEEVYLFLKEILCPK